MSIEPFQALQAHFPLLGQYKYLLIFLASSIEGFSTMMVAGFLLATHQVTLGATFLALSAGEITCGFLWYAVGYWGGGNALEWLVRHSKRQRQALERIRGYMERYTGRAILLAKMTWSITVITEVLAGSIRYSPKKYTLYNIFGSIGWVIVVLGLGYSFGSAYTVAFGYLESVGHVILFIIITVVVVYAAQRLFRGAFLRYVAFFMRVQGFVARMRDGLSRFMSEEEELDRGQKK